MKNKKTSWIDDDSGKISIQKIMNKNIESGTAFHDITQTSWNLIRNNINKKASDIVFEGANSNIPGFRAISKEINVLVQNKKTDEIPNAGGRSAQINLDGSLEMSIGANTIDRVSYVLDTAGSIVHHLGRDKSGRSAIIQTDGEIALEVGGFDFIGESTNDSVDTRFVGRGKSREDTLELDPRQFRSGKIVIKVKRATKDGSGPEENDTLLVIDETGITLKTAGRFDIISDQDMSFVSKSKIILDAPKVQIYKKNPKYVSRSSRIIK
jgi:hypothetical protein